MFFIVTECNIESSIKTILHSRIQSKCRYFYMPAILISSCLSGNRMLLFFFTFYAILNV